MADLKRTIDIILGATDNTGAAFKSVGANLSSIAGNVQSVTAPLADLSAKLQATEAAVLALGAAFAGVAINEAGKFDDAVKATGTLFNANAEQMGRMRDDVLQLGRDIPATYEDINKAVYNYTSITGDAASATGAVQAAFSLADAGGAGLNDTTVVLANSMQAYGATASEAQAYSDALFVTVQQGFTTLPELASGLGQVTGIAAQAGVSFDQLAAAVAGFTASGAGNTASAITSLKSALSNVIKPSAEAAETAASLGIQFDVAGIKSKGFAGFIQEVYDKAGGNIEVLGKMFGSVEGLNAVLALGADKSGKYASALQAMQEKTGAVDKAQQLLGDSVEEVNQRLVNNIKSVLIDAGTPLLEQYGNSVNALSGVFGSLGKSVESGAFQPIMDALNEMGADFQGFLEKIAKNLPEALEGIDYSGFLGSLDSLRGAVGSLFDRFDLGTPEGLQRAIQFVVDSLESLTRVVSGAVSSFKPFIAAAFDAIEYFNGLGDAQQEAAGGILGLSQMLDLILPAVDGIGSGIEAFGVALKSLDALKAIGNIQNLHSALGALNTAMLSAGRAIPLVGAAIAGWELGKSIYEIDAVKNTLADWIDSATGLNESIEENTKQIEGENISALKKYQAEQELAAKSADKLADSQGKQSRGAVDLLDDIYKLTDAYARYEAELPEGQQKIDTLYQLQKQIDSTRESFMEFSESERKSAVQTLTDQRNAAFAAEVAAEKTDNLSKASENLSEKQKDVAKQAKEAADKERELAIRLEEIASNERIKSMEFSVQLKIENLKAQSEQAKAIIDGISKTIDSTGNLLSDLFGNLKGAGSYESLAITDAIEKEQDLREQAIKDQAKLNDALIKMYNAQADRIRRGDPMYKVDIDSTDLEPLEQIGLTILRKLQVAVSLEGANFLMNMPGQ